MPDAHSKFSASSAKRWIACPGSLNLSEGREDKPSVYAAWGTVAHDLAAGALAAGDELVVLADEPEVVSCDGFEIIITRDMVDCVNAYMAVVRDITFQASDVRYEQRVNYAWALGLPEDQAWGTADCVAVDGEEIIVIDLKTGQGVEVSAVENEQLMLYALGVLAKIVEPADRERVQRARLVISQPRVNPAPSEWTVTIPALLAWARGRATDAAASALAADPSFSAGEHCRWCKAAAVCPTLRADVTRTVFSAEPATVEEFSAAVPVKVDSAREAHWLSAALSRVDAIEAWCRSVRAEVERRLLAADDVPGWKLVQGRQGDREWVSEDMAEKYIRERLRLKAGDAYKLKLISPTQAEKLAKAGTIGPRQWPKLQELITRSAGKPSVAAASDPRPALDVRPVSEEFAPVLDDIC